MACRTSTPGPRSLQTSQTARTSSAALKSPLKASHKRGKETPWSCKAMTYAPPVLLQPIEQVDKIQWDATKKSQKPLDPLEQDAYLTLQEKVKNAGGFLKAAVTGPLRKVGDGFQLEVRKFE